MIGRRLLVAGVLALVAAACSGDDDTSPATTIAPPTTEPATSTEATPPPTAPETTQPVPATIPPTLPAEPTTTATSAPPAETQTKQDVIDAAFGAWKSLNDLRLDPNNDDLFEALAQTRTGASLESAIEIITTYRVRNQRSITHPEFPASFEAYPETVEVDVGRGVASVEYCRLGSNTFVETGGNADGTDLVLDDTINTYRERSDLELTDNGWMETGGIVIDKFLGTTVCEE